MTGTTEVWPAKPLEPELVDLLVSPASGAPLRFSEGHLVSDRGERFPVVRGIPRLVESDL
jgi:hypothetical protein